MWNVIYGDIKKKRTNSGILETGSADKYQNYAT
jgi:hypothetical protein